MRHLCDLWEQIPIRVRISMTKSFRNPRMLQKMDCDSPSGQTLPCDNLLPSLLHGQLKSEPNLGPSEVLYKSQSCSTSLLVFQSWSWLGSISRTPFWFHFGEWPLADLYSPESLNWMWFPTSFAILNYIVFLLSCFKSCRFYTELLF